MLILIFLNLKLQNFIKKKKINCQVKIIFNIKMLIIIIFFNFWEKKVSKNQQWLNVFCYKPRLPSTNTDEYKDKSVELIGWGSKVRSGAASDNLKRITIKVFPMRYILNLI
jgi:hypothetical protein